MFLGGCVGAAAHVSAKGSTRSLVISREWRHGKESSNYYLPRGYIRIHSSISHWRQVRQIGKGEGLMLCASGLTMADTVCSV